MDEKISIVIPTYNEIDNIQKLLTNVQDVLEKITPNYEILVVDDNSPDGTGKLAEKVSQRNEKIKFYYHIFHKNILEKKEILLYF